jgi:hypothetical protein
LNNTKNKTKPNPLFLWDGKQRFETTKIIIMASKFWRLTKQDYFMTAIELKKRIPELKNVDADRIIDNLRGTNLYFYKHESVPTPFWIRFTLPLGLITMLILFIFMPVNYIIVGKWGYKWQWLTNWLRALGF